MRPRVHRVQKVLPAFGRRVQRAAVSLLRSDEYKYLCVSSAAERSAKTSFLRKEVSPKATEDRGFSQKSRGPIRA